MGKIDSTSADESENISKNFPEPAADMHEFKSPETQRYFDLPGALNLATNSQLRDMLKLQQQRAEALSQQLYALSDHSWRPDLPTLHVHPLTAAIGRWCNRNPLAASHVWRLITALKLVSRFQLRELIRHTTGHVRRKY